MLPFNANVMNCGMQHKIIDCQNVYLLYQIIYDTILFSYFHA
jgi:hypothetical protein